MMAGQGADPPRPGSEQGDGGAFRGGPALYEFAHALERTSVPLFTPFAGISRLL